MNLVSTLGIDLAKNTFSVHGVDGAGTVVMRRTVSRSQIGELVAQLPACLIGMEPCSGAHEWARRFGRFGHTVKLSTLCRHASQAACGICSSTPSGWPPRYVSTSRRFALGCATMNSPAAHRPVKA